jgi:hypothetical protein
VNAVNSGVLFLYRTKVIFLNLIFIVSLNCERCPRLKYFEPPVFSFVEINNETGESGKETYFYLFRSITV